MRKITEIYTEYKIMPFLQMHQLRVAAVAKQVCESLDIELDKEAIIKACLIHDMGNVIKFDLIQTKLIFGLLDSEIQDIKEVQNEFIQKYRNNEHEATTEIAKNLNLPEAIIKLVSENKFSLLCVERDNNYWPSKILHYADLRVGPLGVLPYDDRMNDAKERYKNHKLSVDEQERQKLVECGRDIEKQIFSHSNIKPDDITDESVAQIIEELKNFEM